MPKLYEITSDLLDVYALLADASDTDAIDTETGALEDDIQGLLDALEGEFTDKAQRIVELMGQLEMDASTYDGPIRVHQEKLAALVKARTKLLGRVDWLNSYLKKSMEALGMKDIQAGVHRLFIKTAGGKQALEWLGQPEDIPAEWQKPPKPYVPEFDRARYDEWRKWYDTWDQKDIPPADRPTGLPDRADELAEMEALFIKQHDRKTNLKITP